MSDNKGFQSMWIPLIIFVALGAAVVGVESVAQPVQYVGIENGCADYTSDNDNDGQSGFIEDGSCHDYPYKDGLGESDTPIGLGGQSPNQYQPYFDLTVDFVRNFVQIECGGNLAGCLGTNFQYESQFYCWFSMNIMTAEFGTIFDKFWQSSPNQYGMINDGSSNVFVNVCKQLTSPSGDLPIIEHQNSDPISENESGEGGRPSGERPRE
jgi:hypothetical protein